MSASTNRSSSAVRNLRSLFEQKQSSADSSAAASPSQRGRSLDGSIIHANDTSVSRPTSKIRASFVSVEPAPGVATTMENGKTDVGDQPAQNPDKPVMGAEEEPSLMKPANPMSESAVSGGNALTPRVEDLRPADEVPTSVDSKKSGSKKPAAISTRATPKSTAASVKSPVNQLRTPDSSKADTFKKEVVKKASRSSLTAPTAASLARAGNTTDRTKTSPTLKPKPREVTRPANVSSHLTAPTAASKARQEPEGSSGSRSSNLRTSLSSRPKPTSSASKPTPRTSLAPRQRAESHSSTTSAARKPGPPPDSSFLDRMTKPTAASQNRVQEKSEAKPEVKSPPRPKPSAPAPKPKASEKPASKPAPKATAPVDSKRNTTTEPSEPEAEPAKEAITEPLEPLTLVEEPQSPETEKHVEAAAPTTEANANPPPVEKEITAMPLTDIKAKDEPAAGSETPTAKQDKDEIQPDSTPASSYAPAPAPDATPAALGEEATIR